MRHTSEVLAGVQRASEMTSAPAREMFVGAYMTKVSGCDKCVRRHRTESELKSLML